MPRTATRRRRDAPLPATVAFDAACSCRAGWQAFRAALEAAARDEGAEAERLSLVAVGREPRLAAPVALLRGRLLLRRGAVEAAIAVFRAGLALTPAAPLLHVSLGHALMLRGDYRAGWEAMEWRRRIDFGDAPFFPKMPGPEWRGEHFDGTLLVRAEQGIGDCLMFARYLPAVARRVGRVILACHRPLVPLLATLPGVSETIELVHGPVAFDRWIFLGSVPRLFGTTLDTIPFAAGFLQADAARRAAWEAKLPPGPRVGLVWAGNPAKEEDARRSLDPAALAGVLAVPGLRFVSLQVGAGGPVPSGLCDLSPDLTDFAETAAAVAGLHLVVSVDTAVAHLAGALGRPCWVLLPDPPDWRWLQYREDSPWYASLRLFRQDRPGDWSGVLARVRAALAAVAAGRRG